MIKSFGDKETEKIYDGYWSKKIDHTIQRKAFRLLVQIDSSTKLIDLSIPPGNRLHDLKDDLKGYHSVSINDQWRIIFLWKDGDAYEVKITDYH